ncbi:MAG: GIY-YIG nuclease family protein [Alphaproteobacteria bacterium]|nr:GIY-YIG nuclease family protein [Alphaproteobacteria bacterium]MBU1514675.1 GIY-YIG nuclease family protein [Alphaproteobacteria bacterium]MBU2093534.1 GIY-YIG nuclease family protein [Alphaproteobacteria bacterium]MBU2149448.1 GIY-YIG nuclease family protein [Alphaproteobacteria bacterium]MBU2305509.1 GIY-YIG nuclease family protein [Alphaproteobacteria bacterium]
MGGYTYILANRPHGTLYIGVTNDLAFRTWQHREGLGSAFCRQYGVHRLVHYEVFEDISNAIHREKRLKKWNRRWKVELIEAGNPQWLDLYETLNC